MTYRSTGLRARKDRRAYMVQCACCIDEEMEAKWYLEACPMSHSLKIWLFFKYLKIQLKDHLMQRAGRYGMLRKLALQFMFSYTRWFHFSGPLHILIPLTGLPSLVIIFRNPIQVKCLSDSFLDPTPNTFSRYLITSILGICITSYDSSDISCAPLIFHGVLLLLQPLLLWLLPRVADSRTSFVQVQTGSASLGAFATYVSLLILGFLWRNAWVTCGYPLSTHTHQLMEVNPHVTILWPLGDKRQRTHSYHFTPWEASSHMHFFFFFF